MPISNIKNDADEMPMHETLRGSCLRAEWNQTTLGEICARQNGSIQTGPFGSQLHTSDYKEFGTPVVMPTNIGDGGIDETGIARISQEDVNRLSQHVLKKGDIVFSRRGDVTKNALVRTRETGWFCGTGCLKVRVGDESVATADFISQYLRLPSIKEWLVRHAVGATMPNLNTGILAAVPVTLPSLDEQKQIAKILDDFDHKIELNRQTNQTLEQIAQVIFKSWFVDFEPTRAKIAAKEAGASNDAIERAAMCAISGKSLEELDQLSPATQQGLKTTAALFPDALVESELGEIPTEWEVSTLGTLIEFNPRRTLKKGVFAPYLDMKNVPTEGHLADDVYLREMASGTKFVNGDTLLARITPCLENGKTAYVDFLEENQVAWGSTEYIVMRPKDGRPLALGYFIARLDTFRSTAIQSMTGSSGRQRADANTLAIQPWIDYPAPLLSQFDLVAGSYLAQAKINGDQNKTLSELRDALLPKLLSGELSISEPSEMSESPC